MFYPLLTVAVSLFALTQILFNLDLTWVQPEVTAYHLPHAISSGSSLVPEDLLNALDFRKFDNGSYRFRVLEYFTIIVNTKFRQWLLHYLPPHPSFSLTWLFTLFLSPFLLFRVTHRLTKNRETAWIAVSLYLLSTGFLSDLAFRFRPGKPLINFLCLLSLDLGSRIRGGKTRSLCFLLASFLIFLAILLDEPIGFFVGAMVPFVFPEVFLGDRLRLFFWTIPYFLAGGFATWIFPQLLHSIGVEEFSFWHYVIRGMGEKPEPLQWSFEALGQNFLSLLSQQLGFGPTDLTRQLSLPFIFAILLLQFRRLPANERKIVSRFTKLGIFFLFYQTVVLMRHLHVIPSSYYYGSLFSVLFPIPLAIALTPIKNQVWSKRILILCFLTCFTLNFRQATKAAQGIYTRELDRTFEQPFRDLSARLLSDTPLTYPTIVSFWKNRYDKPVLIRRLRELPHSAHWLAAELWLLPPRR